MGIKVRQGSLLIEGNDSASDSELQSSDSEYPFHVGLLNFSRRSRLITRKLVKKIALHPVDLKLGSMIGYEISQSLAEFRHAGLICRIFENYF